MLCISAANAVVRFLSVRLLVRMSVLLFVTFVYCVKTGNRILKHFVTTSSHTVLAFPRRTLWQYSDGNRPNEGVECSWGRQKSRFSTNIWLYHGYDKDKAIVTMKRQQELVYAMYQMVPFPMSTE